MGKQNQKDERITLEFVLKNDLGFLMTKFDTNGISQNLINNL